MNEATSKPAPSPSTSETSSPLAGELLDVHQMAALTRMKAWTIRCNATRAPHRLPPVLRIGGRLLFRRKDVDAWLESKLEWPTEPQAPKRGRGRPRKQGRRVTD